MIRVGPKAFAGYGAIGCISLLLVPPLVMLAMCSESDSDQTVLEPPRRFAELALAGSAQDAKRAGFTDCSVTGETATCIRRPVTFMGRNISSAEVTLADYSKSTFDPKTATFEGVTLKFAGQKDRDDFLAALQSSGWIKRSWRNSDYLEKAGNAVRLEWSDSENADWVNVGRESLEDVADQLEREAARKLPPKAEIDFVQDMKN